jgi:uncharacterized damage-inducible protein DinB
MDPRIGVSLLFALVAATAFGGPCKPGTQNRPLSTFNKSAYTNVGQILLRAAEKMPEENYSFRPADSVRTYGQIIGHLADAQYMFCSTELGEKDPEPKIEQTRTSKADLIAALQAAFAYCDKAYDGLTDASAAQTVTLFGAPTPKLGRPHRQQHAQHGALRQSRHLHAHEEHRPAHQRDRVRTTSKELIQQTEKPRRIHHEITSQIVPSITHHNTSSRSIDLCPRLALVSRFRTVGRHVNDEVRPSVRRAKIFRQAEDSRGLMGGSGDHHTAAS